MVVYLPIALMKDWFSSLFHSDSSKNLYSDNSLISSSFGLNVPLRLNDMCNDLETDMRSFLMMDKDIRDSEEGCPLIVKDEEDEMQNSELSSWDIAKYSLYLAPVWFTTEVIRSVFSSPIP